MYQKVNETGGRGETLAPSVSKVGLESPQVSLRGFPASPVILSSTANLDRLPSVPFYEPARCDPKYIVLQCNCGRTIVPSSCMSLDCVACKDQVGKRRAQSVIRRLIGQGYGQKHRFNRTTVIYTVLTIPKQIRDKFYSQPKEWRKVRKKVWYVLKNYFGGKYGVEATHPVGDKDKKTFHPHLNFLWVQRRGFRPFIDVARLRHEWEKILKVDQADVYSQYTTHIRRIIHWAKYVTRTFPGTHAWTGPLRWFGRYPKVKITRECYCSECQARFRVIGFLDARLIDEWQKTGMLIGRDPPWYDDKLIDHVKTKKNLI